MSANEKPGLDGLLPSQTRALLTPLNRVKVSIKPGKKFPYLSGPNAINHLNRIFGFGGWSTEMVQSEVGTPYQTKDGGSTRLTAWCFIKLIIKRPDGQTFERLGYGAHTAASSNLSDLYDQAPAAALTFALRNAAITLGHQLGLAVTRIGKTDNWGTFTTNGDPAWPDFGGGSAAPGNGDVMPGDDHDGEGAMMPTTSQQVANHQQGNNNNGGGQYDGNGGNNSGGQQYQNAPQQAPAAQVHQPQAQPQPAPVQQQAQPQAQQQAQPAPVQQQQQVQQPTPVAQPQVQQQPQQQSAPQGLYDYRGPALDDGWRGLISDEIRAVWGAMLTAEKQAAEQQQRQPVNVSQALLGEVAQAFGVAVQPADVPKPERAGGPPDRILVALLAEFRRRAPQGFQYQGQQFQL